MSEERMVSVLSDNDQEIVAQAESILRDAGIHYYVRTRHFSMNPFANLIDIMVRVSDVQAAHNALSELRKTPSRRPLVVRILAIMLLLAVVILYGWYLLSLYR